MTVFKSKKIKTHQGIGNILQEARAKTGLSLKIVAKHIHINQKHLAALENDDWQQLPGEIYAKNFLKTYVQFLKIDPKEIKVDFNKIPHSNHKNHHHEFKKKTRHWDFLDLPKILKFILIVTIIFLILFYIAQQIQKITEPPQIILSYPLTDLTTSHNSLSIIGQTEPEVKIRINNEEIILDKDSTFKQKIDLLPGLNTITIEGKKKYSRPRVMVRLVVYEP